MPAATARKLHACSVSLALFSCQICSKPRGPFPLRIEGASLHFCADDCVAQTTGGVARHSSPSGAPPQNIYSMFFIIRRHPRIKVGRLHGVVVGSGAVFVLRVDRRFCTGATSCSFGNSFRSAMLSALPFAIPPRLSGLHKSMSLYAADMSFDVSSGLEMRFA